MNSEQRGDDAEALPNDEVRQLHFTTADSASKRVSRRVPLNFCCYENTR